MNTKGFTLIELIIVVILLAALAGGIIATIHPFQLLHQQTDIRVQRDVADVARAMRSYMLVKQYYPATLEDLMTIGELKQIPDPPAGYTPYTIAVTPDGCSTEAQTCTGVAVGGQIKAPVTEGDTVWCWHSSTGVAVESATCSAP